MTTKIPPFISVSDKVILFDGVCKLCNGWSRFIINHDQQRIFKLASLQSPEGQAILKFFAMPTEQFDTLLYLENVSGESESVESESVESVNTEGGSIEGVNKYQKSDAILKILAQLSWPWRLLTVARMIPRPLRDWIYDRVARNRYMLFGKHDSYNKCLLPSADHESRFLTGG